MDLDAAIVVDGPPLVVLCGAPSPDAVRCDREAGHPGRHTWELHWTPPYDREEEGGS